MGARGTVDPKTRTRAAVARQGHELRGEELRIRDEMLAELCRPFDRLLNATDAELDAIVERINGRREDRWLAIECGQVDGVTATGTTCRMAGCDASGDPGIGPQLAPYARARRAC